MTTTTTYENTMEHRFVPLADDSLLVLAADGPARVMPDGKVKWKSEWDWKIGAINFKPAVTNDGLIYQYKKQLTYFSLDDGSMIWQSKEKKDAGSKGGKGSGSKGGAKRGAKKGTKKSASKKSGSEEGAASDDEGA